MLKVGFSQVGLSPTSFQRQLESSAMQSGCLLHHKQGFALKSSLPMIPFRNPVPPVWQYVARPGQLLVNIGTHVPNGFLQSRSTLLRGRTLPRSPMALCQDTKHWPSSCPSRDPRGVGMAMDSQHEGQIDLYGSLTLWPTLWAMARGQRTVWLDWDLVSSLGSTRDICHHLLHSCSPCTYPVGT
jgi:hypothetical protein